MKSPEETSENGDEESRDQGISERDRRPSIPSVFQSGPEPKLHLVKSTAKLQEEDGTHATGERRISETLYYLERIDALEAKLRFMTEDSIAVAKRSAEQAECTSSERLLAERDEKIGLLMLEGEKLSQVEMKHLSAIKKLRLKSIEDEKSLRAARTQLDEAYRTSNGLRDQLQYVESASTKDASSQDPLETANLLRESQAENARLSTRLEQLQTRLATSNASDPLENVNKLRSQLNAEQKRTSELENALAATETSTAVSEDHLKRHLQDLQNTADREKERARLAEVDLRRELQVRGSGER